MNNYYILLKDVGLTHNINMHTFHCSARSKEEAIGKMVMKRPDYNVDDIQRVTEISGLDSKKVYYFDKTFKSDIQKAKNLINNLI